MRIWVSGKGPDDEQRISVFRIEPRPSGAGPAYPPLVTTPWTNASGVVVTFTLVTGNAKFADGTTRFTATSG